MLNSIIAKIKSLEGPLRLITLTKDKFDENIKNTSKLAIKEFQELFWLIKTSKEINQDLIDKLNFHSQDLEFYT